MKKTSIFLKISATFLGIILGSNLILSYILYRAYETLILNAKPYLPEKVFEEIYGNISNTWAIVIATLIFILLVSLLFVILFTANLLRPLYELLEAISEIKKGNLRVQAKIKTNDEFEELAKQFNSMVVNLRLARDMLEEQKNILEVRVKARTRELEELAQSLEEKVKERTRELEERIEELEKIHRLTVERELKMVELKKKIEELQKKEK